MEGNVGYELGRLLVLILAFYFITLVQKKKKEDNWKPIILLFLSFLVGSNIAYLGKLSGYYTLGITIGVFVVSLIYSKKLNTENNPAVDTKKEPSLFKKIILKIKSSKNLQIAIGIALIIIAVSVYRNHSQEKQWACLQRIEYDNPEYTYDSAKGGYLYFKNQKEALDYCFTEMKYYKF